MSRIVLAAMVLVATTHLWSTDALGAPGFKGWTFGMSKKQVRKVKKCKPYKPVKVTKGLECPNFKFGGAKNNISFVFRGGGLAKIQVWMYRGKSAKNAARRLHEALNFYRSKYGKVESPVGKVPRKLKKLKKMVKEMASSGRLAKTQFKPKKNPGKYFTFTSLIHHPVHGFYVFLYFQPPR